VAAPALARRGLGTTFAPEWNSTVALNGKPELMPTAPDFPLPRRYNSLRLAAFDYSNTSSLFFISINTHERRPVFADFKLAKSTLSTLLNEHTLERICVHAYTLMPDHFHLLAGVKSSGKLSDSLGYFKSYTTSQFWKRSRELHKGESLELPGPVERAVKDRATAELLSALMEWRIKLRPEAVELKGWPKARGQHFISKRLWQGRFHEHIIRNEIDLNETIEYIVMNPVKRGYVSRPQFYPFTGFNPEL
jgi:REP element-mobilizing transposase RayT